MHKALVRMLACILDTTRAQTSKASINADLAMAILQEEQRIRIGFTGEFGPNRVSPRELTSSLISSLVNLEGIVTKCSLVRPKVVKSVHYAEATGQFLTRQYR